MFMIVAIGLGNKILEYGPSGLGFGLSHIVVSYSGVRESIFKRPRHQAAFVYGNNV